MSAIQHDPVSRIAAAASLGPRIAQMGVCSVGRNEGLSLGGNRSEHAFLVETHAIGATSIGGAFKARATNLWAQNRSVLGLLRVSTAGTIFSPSCDGNSGRQSLCAALGQQPGRLLGEVVVERTCRAVDMGQAAAEGGGCKDLERLVRMYGQRPCRMVEAVVEDSLMEDMKTEGKMAEDMKTDAMEDNSEGSWSENKSIVDAPMEDAVSSRRGLVW